MKIPYNILIQIKMSVRPYFKGFTLIFFSITVENRIIAVSDGVCKGEFFGSSLLSDSNVIMS